MTPDTTTIAEIEAALPRPADITSTNRNQVRRWLTAHGVPYSTAGKLTIAELSELYNQGDTDKGKVKIDILALSKEEAAPIPTPPAWTPAQPMPQMTPAPAPAGNTLQAAAALLEMLTPKSAPMDETRVIDLIHEHAPKAEPRTIRIELASRPAVTLDRQHWKMPLLLACAAARVPAFLVGPAGTGKTSAAHAAATACGLEFGAISVGPMTSKSDLFGMLNAKGEYNDTELTRRATQGGIFLFDELDAGHAGVVTQINMLTANGSFATPAGMQKKHVDFLPLFAMNTFGNGASREYVGRNQLDAATLDRGAFIDWPLDEGLEASFLGIDEPSPTMHLDKGGVPNPAGWLSYVRSFRAAVEKNQIRAIVSPRALILGNQLAAAGVGIAHLKEMLLFKGMDAATRAKITAAL